MPTWTPFQDIDRHHYFNTNSLWLRLDLLKEQLAADAGVLPLPMIRNNKTVDPRDKKSTARGPAGNRHGRGHRVLRRRGGHRRAAQPVRPGENHRRTCSPCAPTPTRCSKTARSGSPPRAMACHLTLSLSDEYKLVDQIETLGVPSLINCDSLKVERPDPLRPRRGHPGRCGNQKPYARAEDRVAPGSTKTSRSICGMTSVTFSAYVKNDREIFQSYRHLADAVASLAPKPCGDMASIGPFSFPTNGFDAVIFDCDGTLVDSMPAHFDAWCEALALYGAGGVFKEDVFFAMGGRPTMDIVVELNDEYDLKLDPADVALAKREAFLKRLQHGHPDRGSGRLRRIPPRQGADGDRHRRLADGDREDPQNRRHLRLV